MRLRALASLTFCALSAVAAAQPSKEPLVRTELELEKVVPGQLTVLRVTLLTPTWMLKPPDLPTFDMPNLMVRLSERATTPVSERIEGETWSGITRAYQLSPLVPGAISVPAQTIQITYADPETRDPIIAEVETTPFTLTGSVPEAAKDLDPFIAAESLEIDQEIEGDPAALAIGDALTRRVTVRILGTSSMMIPSLIMAEKVGGLGYYPAEPVLAEKPQRGVLSGSRTEEATFIAEGGGRFTLPEVRLDWFNLKTGAVESAVAPAIELAVSGPTASSGSSAFDARAVLPLGAGLLFSVLTAYLLWRLRPLVHRAIAQRRAIYRASELYAYRRAIRALDARLIDQSLTSIEAWWRRATEDGAPVPREALAPIAEIGSSRYAASAEADSSMMAPAWRRAREALDEVRGKVKLQRSTKSLISLPPLNPPCPDTAGQRNV